MTTLTIEVPPALYERLHKEAQQAGQPVEVLITTWLESRVPTSAPADERARARKVLRAAGLLAEPSPEMLAIAAQSTTTLQEVQATFARIGGKLLSKIVIEQRGPKG